MIVTPNIGDKAYIEFKNLKTGEIRLEVWERVAINGSTAYQSPSGRLYTKGVIGWVDVTHLI